jgi:hypothetical protein
MNGFLVAASNNSVLVREEHRGCGVFTAIEYVGLDAARR